MLDRLDDLALSHLRQTVRIRSGKRYELIAVLRALSDGWEHFANDARKAEADAALRGLRNGEMSVRAGHTEYHVAEGAE
jgi:hypothetical protein